MKRIISTSAAPAAVGPYSQGVEASGATLYVSGQLPIDPADGTMPDTVEQQTEQALRNVEAILREAGYSLSDVVKSVVLLADMNDFAAMNAIYARFYAKDMPARVCYEVGASADGRPRRNRNDRGQVASGLRRECLPTERPEPFREQACPDA